MSEALERWKSSMIEKDFITKKNNENSEIIASTKGNAPLKVRVSAKKLNNKNVTIVEGLDKFVNIKDTVKTFAKHFACAVTIKEYQGSKEAIFIQGYWVNDLLEILENEFKLNKKFIQVEDKLKLKVKK
jgi:translation initiation factor 1 (eIF-1/SUI1)